MSLYLVLAKDLAGQWMSLKGEAASVIKEGFSWIGDDFASAFDNIGGYVTDIFGDASGEGLKSALTEKLKTYATEMLTKLFEQMGMPIGSAGPRPARPLVQQRRLSTVLQWCLRLSVGSIRLMWLPI